MRVFYIFTGHGRLRHGTGTLHIFDNTYYNYLILTTKNSSKPSWEHR